jgi:hypothetical protein
MVGRQFAKDEGNQAENAQTSEDTNVVGGEPVFALSGIEKHLQRTDSHRKQANAPEVNFAVSTLHVMRVEYIAVHQE